MEAVLKSKDKLSLSVGKILLQKFIQFLNMSDLNKSVYNLCDVWEATLPITKSCQINWINSFKSCIYFLMTLFNHTVITCSV
jgi:hypothetical protein